MKYDVIHRIVRRMYERWAGLFKEFKVLWKNYLFQSMLAAIVILIVFWLLRAEQAVIIASIGSTAFIVFTMPSAVTSKSRRVIDGHVVGFISGMIGILILSYLAITPIVTYALAVGLSIFLMVVLDVEHPPASGTALGVAINGFSLKIMTTVFTSAIILSLAHHYVKKYIKDLV